MVGESGWTYDPPPERIPNSRKALEVTEEAREHGLHDAVHTRLMHAYWSERADLGDETVLLDLVSEAGLDRDTAAEAIADRRWSDRVDESTRRAYGHGINAIPAFVLDRRLLLVGAYPHETFDQAFAQLETEREG